MKWQRLITRVTERGDELDHPVLGRKSEGGKMGGREMKKVRRSRRDGRETQPGCTSPVRLQTSVRVGVCESKSETVTLRGGGAASVPFFSNKPPWGGI